MKLNLFPAFETRVAQQILKTADSAEEDFPSKIIRVIKQLLGLSTTSLYALHDQMAQLTSATLIDSREFCAFMDTVSQAVETVAPKTNSKKIALIAKEILKTQSKQWGPLFTKIDTQYRLGFLDKHYQGAMLATACAVVGAGIGLYYFGTDLIPERPPSSDQKELKTPITNTACYPERLINYLIKTATIYPCGHMKM